MADHKIYAMPFAKVYPCYVTKAEKKGRTKAEVNQIIYWLTGYDEVGLHEAVQDGRGFQQFLSQAPQLNPLRSKIKGVICGIRIENIEDDTMREIRYLDKLIDELAKGKALAKILRD